MNGPSHPPDSSTMGGFNSLRVRTRMQILSVLTLFGLLLLCLVALLHLKDSMLEDRKQKSRKVVNATREQAIAANDIARNVEQVSQTAGKTTATMHVNADSAAELNAMASDLRAQLAYFQVK